MNTEISNSLMHIVILDISGIYAQIHNQGYFDAKQTEEIKKQYSDTQFWRVVELEK